MRDETKKKLLALPPDQQKAAIEATKKLLQIQREKTSGYRQMKPLFEDIWQGIKATGANPTEAAQELAKQLVGKFGAQIKPFAMEFYRGITQGGNQDAEHSRADLERDSEDAAAQDGLGESDLSAQPSETDADRRDRREDADGLRYEPGRDSVLPRSEAATPRERSDSGVPDDTPRPDYRPAERADGERSDNLDDHGMAVEPVAPGAVGTAAKESSPNDKLVNQRQVSEIAISPGDRKNVDDCMNRIRALKNTLKPASNCKGKGDKHENGHIPFLPYYKKESELIVPEGNHPPEWQGTFTHQEPYEPDQSRPASPPPLQSKILPVLNPIPKKRDH